ncbi:hypothetical protein [Rhizobium leguminosarum]|uniref:hypothetical protein n=1 Tax=Rhizobium leguminosarum TaxID=384 RepID=UPI001FEF7369|nr:hypothetical protein [Rhizobium leguminosarum]
MALEYTIPGMLIRDHMVDAPLDWSKPEGRRFGFLHMKCAIPPAVATNSNMMAFASRAAVLRGLMTLIREQGGALAS